jgi:hypothetical protein
MGPVAAELGLDFLQFYVAGRAGVLGRTSPDVVVAALGLFEPGLVRARWTEACAIVDPALAAAQYAQVCVEVGRQRPQLVEVAPRLCMLAARVVDAVELPGLPLFAGWRELPLPPDATGRAAQLLQVLREHRGGLHGLALRACGLSPRQAIVAGPDGPDRAVMLGWSAPWPDPEPLRAAWARAERMTDELAAPAYAALHSDERAELVRLLDHLMVAPPARGAGPR